MKPVWTKAAIRELVHIREYIARDNAEAAREIALRIVDATGRIIQFPESGRSGRVNGTREFVVSVLDRLSTEEKLNSFRGRVSSCSHL